MAIEETLINQTLDLLADKVAEKMIQQIKPLLSPPQENLIDKKQLAEYLGVDVTWIDRQVAARGIPFIRVGKYRRFKRSDIERWLERPKMRS